MRQPSAAHWASSAFDLACGARHAFDFHLHVVREPGRATRSRPAGGSLAAM
ncbi:hypothetical protein HAV22_13810 [Massilia sp. TW-1]|uniref:Uncharacterized protein n=1 Tax=Telluria antibiotica TaxID=2717319 RepID=A0ABX0PBJ7_9BURK|nr:hypothetical protein [Telluria antibiotica]NIA54713.1 hypothetical protein [Telluria antibiotica]